VTSDRQRLIYRASIDLR